MRVGAESSSCDHDPDALTYLGDDGLNTYIECRDCEAVFVIGGGVEGLADRA